MNEDSGGGGGGGGEETKPHNGQVRGRGGRGRGRGGRGRSQKKSIPRNKDRTSEEDSRRADSDRQSQDTGTGEAARGLTQDRNQRGKHSRNYGKRGRGAPGKDFDNQSRHHMSYHDSYHGHGYDRNRSSNGYNGNFYGPQEWYNGQDLRFQTQDGFQPNEYESHGLLPDSLREYGHRNNPYSGPRRSYNSDYRDQSSGRPQRNGRGRGRENFSRDQNRNEQKQRSARDDADEGPPREQLGALQENVLNSRQVDPKLTKKPRKRLGQGRASDKDSNLRDRLTESLMKGTSECMVCLDKVKQQQATWDCRNCFQVFHIGCIKKWAKSVTVEGSWRCPGCQVSVTAVPRDYTCFCGKLINPEWIRNEGLVPHTCGEICGRPLATGDDIASCPHTCSDLCHPGPCNPCTAKLRKTCPCGATSSMVKCEVQLVCGGVCGKLLSCEQHTCSLTCHAGDCDTCQVMVTQVCFCGQSTRELLCGLDVRSSANFNCGKVCNKTLDCGQHNCEAACHEGACAPCPLSPEAVTHCPCGKTPIRSLVTRGAQPRLTCADPVPVCEAVCERVRKCGPPSAPHLCRDKCHTGQCSPCGLTTKVRCRCGAMDQEIPCTELTTRADDARCGRRCQKRRSCGRHKCGEECCIRLDHPCPLICNKLLSCRLHHCQDLCHTGNCKRCPNVSFDELSCECGASVLYPPVHCGTKPPECREPCRRRHRCDHPVTHSCHSEESCPPCATLTTKLCYGGHEERRSVPCLVEGVSCGRQCRASLPCGRHSCQRICHPGECLKENEKCNQPCQVVRPSCGHPCGAPCHDGGCPGIPCPTQVKIACECGRRQTSVSCSDNNFSKLSTSVLASQMADMRAGISVDLAELAKRNRKLDCDEECMKRIRNAKLAEVLGIENPELSSKVIPKYSDFMKDFVKRDSELCSMVYNKLVELVKLSKESKQKSRSFSFPIMNRDKRQLVHEYAEHFGCESQSYDAEPKRNVVVTALREKSAIPSLSLMDVVGRQKKAPTPMIDGASDSLPATFTPLTRNASDTKIDWFG